MEAKGRQEICQLSFSMSWKNSAYENAAKKRIFKNNWKSTIYTITHLLWQNVILFFILLPDAYPAHSRESFCSSDISLDDSTNLDEGGSDTLSLELGPPPHPHPHPHPSEGLLLGQINPIDKLYLMQNSYFSSSEQWNPALRHSTPWIISVYFS